MKIDAPKQASNEQRERHAIIISLLFLLVGFIILWVTKSLIKIEGDAVLISLLLIPILSM
jgi:hypothetical protein